MKPSKTKGKLTPKQERFCREYVIDLNATQAAIRSGYSEKTAGQIGEQNLKKLEIASFIKDLQEKLQEQTGVTSQMVIRELAKIGFCDPRKLFSVDGSLVGIRQLDDETAAVVSSIEIAEITVGSGEDRIVVGHTKKVKMWDKVSALEKLGRHLGIFEKDNSQKPLIVAQSYKLPDGTEITF